MGLDHQLPQMHLLRIPANVFSSNVDPQKMTFTISRSYDIYFFCLVQKIKKGNSFPMKHLPNRKQ